MLAFTAEAHHVRCLWRMGREMRIRLWEELQPGLHLEELGLGGEDAGTWCSVDDEELAILSPTRSLRWLRDLCLDCANKLTDIGLRKLAEAGCGTNLTSLTLSGMVFFLHNCFAGWGERECVCVLHAHACVIAWAIFLGIPRAYCSCNGLSLLCVCRIEGPCD